MSLEALQSIAGLDAEQGLKNCMDDESLYVSIVGMYIEQIKEYRPQLEEHHSSENWEEYGKLAHSVKGASASVGLFAVQELSQTIEHAAKQGEFVTIIDKHTDYLAMLDNIMADLAEAI